MRKRTAPRTDFAMRTICRALCSVGPPASFPIGMKSVTSAMPSSVKKRVISTLVSGRYICLASPSAAGARRQKPPMRSSRIAPKMLGESNRGRQHQSIDPFVPTRATERISPMIP